MTKEEYERRLLIELMRHMAGWYKDSNNAG